MKKLMILFVLIAAIPIRAAEAQPAAPPVVTVPVSATAPKLDGAIGENEWAGPVVQGFYQPNGDLMDPRGGRFALACDGTNLYVAVETPVHPRFGPVERNRSLDTIPRQPDDVVFEDSIEIWLAPGLSGPAEGAYQIMFDTRGGYSPQRFVDPTPSIHFFNVGWDLKGELARCSVIRDSRWTLETAIPLAALGSNAPGAGLRLRVCRNYKMPWSQTRDNSGVVYYKDPATMMQVRFAERASLVIEPDWTGTATEPRLTLRNPGTEPLKVHVDGKALDLGAHAVQELPVAVRTENQVRRADILVTAPDGTVIHRRAAAWSDSPKALWEDVL